MALLPVAVAGILLTALVGSARIMRLRATARKHRRAGRRAVKAEARTRRRSGGSPDYREPATGCRL